MTRLNQPLWNAPAPDGWSDAGGEWAAPEQLMRRLDWVGEVWPAGPPRAAASSRDALAETVLGPSPMPRR
jgi:uncharacterized protein (DUF1800 family)